MNRGVANRQRLFYDFKQRNFILAFMNRFLIFTKHCGIIFAIHS